MTDNPDAARAAAAAELRAMRDQIRLLNETGMPADLAFYDRVAVCLNVRTMGKGR
jgi:hypothetical protein